MANQITDGRSNLTNAENTTGFVDISGAGAGTSDSEIFIQGSASNSQYLGSSLDGLMYDIGTATNLSNNHFYIWVNCGIVGLLATKAAGGFRIRFSGATITDFFEVYVGGSDSWPASIQGGWTMFVVDIESASASPSNTGGTPPATSAIRYVGWAGITGGTMPRMVDNTWLDSIWRLPDGSAGIIVEGLNGGSDWTWDDIVDNSDAGAWGTAIRSAGGAVQLNTPVQFFVNDATTHGFSDTNQTILWDNQEFVAADLYGITVLGGSGTMSFQAGEVSGSGATRVGSQGWTISAAASGVRWFIDCDDANIDACNFYGCSFQHGADFQLDQANVDIISCFFIDCESANINNADIANNSIVNAATADGVAFFTSDDLADFTNTTFNFSDGHGIEITSTAGSPFTFSGNVFNNYLGTAGSNLTPASGSTDAAIYNNSGGAIVIDIGGGGSTPSIRNGTGATTTVNNNISVTLEGMVDSTEVKVFLQNTTTLVAGTEAATSGTSNDRSFSFSTSAGTLVDIRIFNQLYEPADILGFEVPTQDTSIPIQQRFDRNYVNSAATGPVNTTQAWNEGSTILQPAIANNRGAITAVIWYDNSTDRTLSNLTVSGTATSTGGSLATLVGSSITVGIHVRVAGEGQIVNYVDGGSIVPTWSTGSPVEVIYLSNILDNVDQSSFTIGGPGSVSSVGGSSVQPGAALTGLTGSRFFAFIAWDPETANPPTVDSGWTKVFETTGTNISVAVYERATTTSTQPTFSYTGVSYIAGLLYSVRRA